MIKRKIGAALCLLSALGATLLYFALDRKVAESWVILLDIRFCRLYYPLLCLLDAIVLVNVFLKAHVNRVKKKNQRNLFERFIDSKWLEAVFMWAYVALNLFLAVKIKEVYELDFWVPMMWIKAVFFAVLYHVQAIFAFREDKFWMRMLALNGILILAYLVNKYLQLELDTRRLDINLLINSYLYDKGRVWPESRYWMTNALIVALECVLPAIRLIGLALYNTRHKKPKLKERKTEE